MCYTDGPLCSDYAEARVKLAEKHRSAVRSADSIRSAQTKLSKAHADYDMTPRGQDALRQEIAEGPSLDAQTRLDVANQTLRDLTAITGNTYEGESDEAHIPSGYEDTNPALSIPVPDPIGRVYRRPGAENALPTGPNGGVKLPTVEVIREKVISGQWLPSITNVIGVRSAPHLIGWAAGKAVKSLNDSMTRNPQKVKSNPVAAMNYAELASDRDRDAAAMRGTKVHYACEQVSMGRVVHPSYLSAEEWKYVDSFHAWMDKFKPEFIAREVTVFGTTPAGDYAGTADFIARIGDKIVAGDYKTTRSGLHLDVAFQLSAVVHATHYTTDGENLLPMMHIDAAVGVLLSATDYEMRQAIVRGVPWDVFCGLRAAWIPHVLDGAQPDGQDILSQPLTSPDSLVADI